MIGHPLIELETVGSTNTYAGELFAQGDFADGTVVWAHEQYAGRGQHDHIWSSEPGKNLTFTVCLKPRFLAPEHQFQLNKAITLGILDFLTSVTHHASLVTRHASRIKWPNDIYLGDRKIGGILIENRIMGSELAVSFVGIGLNINQTRFAPDLPNPVSLIHVLSHEIDLKEAMNGLCGFLEQRFQAIQQGEAQALGQEFDRNLLGYEEWRTYSVAGGFLEGRIKGVDPSGCLLVEDRNGGITAYGHGEIVTRERGDGRG
jgi:BirA family biotin operon repressor/biotin-[acetyl-CoA-carboxylase] ligase